MKKMYVVIAKALHNEDVSLNHIHICLLGVFSTEEKAREAAKEWGYSKYDYEIREVSLDESPEIDVFRLSEYDLR